jgi:hypothetical protein
MAICQDRAKVFLAKYINKLFAGKIRNLADIVSGRSWQFRFTHRFQDGTQLIAM